jgi:choline dehydrogenase-like flavoprotein
LSESDVENIKYAIVTLVKLGQAAGAKKVIIPTKPGILLNLQNSNEVNDFIQHFETYPLQLTDLFMGTAHPQGGNKMASQQHSYERVVDENFAVVGLDNVYVADASVFPTSINVNPQLTIMAMASLAAKKIFAKHR